MNVSETSKTDGLSELPLKIANESEILDGGGGSGGGDERAGLPSGSGWRRYELCPGSYQLGQQAKALGQEAHALPTSENVRGTRIHAWLAGSKIELSDSEQISADFLAERALEQVNRIFGPTTTTGQIIEKRLWLLVDGRRVASGRADRVIWSGKTALVQDFKTGFSEPDPAEINAQLKILAVLAALELTQVETVYVQIISGPYGVTEKCYSIPELADAYRDILVTLKKINAPHALFAPSDEACRYCPAINICQAVKDLSGPITRLSYSSLPEGGARAAKLLDEVSLLQNYLDEIRGFYSRRLSEAPDAVPGYSMEAGAPKRAVTDWKLARQKLEEFLDKEQLDALANYSIPKIENLLAKKMGLKGTKLKNALQDILGDLLELKYPEPSLKRVSGQPKIE